MALETFDSAETRLKELGIELPGLSTPDGNYLHAVQSGNLLFLAGKGPDNSLGKVGRDVSVETAYDHAREAGLYLLSVLRLELGSLDRVRRIVRVFGMVNAPEGFPDSPKVINGCSDLFVEVFGEKGRHARCAIGVSALPNNMTVEIEAIVEIET